MFEVYQKVILTKPNIKKNPTVKPAVFLNILALTLFLFTLFLLPQAAFAFLNPVIINEIAWMGTEASYSNEWIELFNNSSSSVDISGWTLSSEDKKIEISLVGEIQAHGFFLLERTDDNSVSAVVADQIYTGSLGNNGENLILSDEQGNKVNEVICLQGWLAGDNSTKQTMERTVPSLKTESSKWQTSENNGGTPKESNSLPLIKKEFPDQEEDNDFIQKTYPQKIFLNELLPSPEGPDSEHEWIELFNQNNFAVDISGWKISDGVGTTRTYSFPVQTIIQANNFLILKRTESNITLNNSEDVVVLILPDSTIIETVSYKEAQRGKSYAKNSLGNWEWSQNPSPKEINTFDIQDDIEEKAVSEIKSPNLLEKNKQKVAIVSSQVPREKDNLPAIIPALLTATLSVIIILLLKSKISSNPR